MWFFFRNCPLAELQTEDGDMAKESTDSAAQSETAKRPRLSVGVFSALLCTLLLNQNATIAEATQFALTM